MSTLNVAVADEKKNMQSLLKGMEFLGTAKSSDEAYSMINANAGSDVVLVYVKRERPVTRSRLTIHICRKNPLRHRLRISFMR